MKRYIGLDVHATSTTFAVVSESGKRLGTYVVETNGQALVERLKTIPGDKYVVLEEGTQSGWLYEILSPHSEDVVVAAIAESRGQKDDERDAYKLAEELRTGAIKRRVFKDGGQFTTLRALSRTHAMVVQDVVRIQNRLKSLYRGRGIAVSGQDVYSETGRQEALERLPGAVRGAAATLYTQYDAVEPIRRQAEKALVSESHRHPISRVLESCPGLGPIRVAQLLPIVVTPMRFRTRRQFWSYCGLGVVMRSSSDWVPREGGGWKRAEVQQTRGLNENHNHVLKNVFKGAATTVITQLKDEPLHQHYQRLLAAGTKPNPGVAHRSAQDRCHRSVRMEEQGEIRPDEASQAKLIACLPCDHAPAEHRLERWRSTWTQARFEGEHLYGFWHRSTSPDVPRIGYAPSEFRMKRWPTEVLIEGWFPLFAREHERFDVAGDANEISRRSEGSSSSALASGSEASCGRVGDREAGKPCCLCPLHPDKPRRTCRLGADASVEDEHGRRSGGICLDTTFHRRKP